MNESKRISTYTQLSPEERKKVLKWVAKQNEETVLFAFEKQKEFLFKFNKVQEENKSVIYLSSLYLACSYIYNAHISQKTKNRVTNIDDVPDMTSMQAKQFKNAKQAKKYNRLLNLKNKIIALKDDENLSYRKISAFLERFHEFCVSHTYIASFYKQHYNKDKK